jgi:hypothetical protein
MQAEAFRVAQTLFGNLVLIKTIQDAELFILFHKESGLRITTERRRTAGLPGAVNSYNEDIKISLFISIKDEFLRRYFKSKVLEAFTDEEHLEFVDSTRKWVRKVVGADAPALTVRDIKEKLVKLYNRYLNVINSRYKSRAAKTPVKYILLFIETDLDIKNQWDKTKYFRDG